MLSDSKKEEVGRNTSPPCAVCASCNADSTTKISLECGALAPLWYLNTQLIPKRRQGAALQGDASLRFELDGETYFRHCVFINRDYLFRLVLWEMLAAWREHRGTHLVSAGRQTVEKKTTA